MVRITRRTAFGLGAGALAAGLARPAAALVIQRPGRTIVGFPAGGSSDVVARLYAERLRGVYAPQVLVENRTGAAGRIAVEAVKAAPPDGETWLQTPASMFTLQPHVFPRQVRYDALTDFAPVTTVATFPFALAVPANHPARDFQGFVAWARAQQDIPYASPAAGAAPHFMGVILARAIGARMTHVSYRGAAPAVQDLIGGRIQAFMGVLGDITPHLGQGLRILAVSSERRNPRYPDFPTFAELGLGSLTKEEWFGVALPAGTPAPIVRGLYDALTRAAATPEMREALEKLDYGAVTSPSPAAFAERIRREREEWAAVVRDSGVQLED
ncbi:tripartite tricarboxylate transporter substrate-binding protein [Crenalkalicoccus roseus]|uniref:tripartite tricarboxylate transporter substrate-binding protein n=1 Tax=Crenalkalicoccus roseus TaxID=1485588 RepID=UPI001080E432|nr:tripartite tricarboxylate transporter substrate-binding protein [Crenalkalicoccus roseus]